MTLKEPRNIIVSRERYFLVEADGEASIMGYTQRPAAVRKAERSGKGLWDNREKTWVVEVDFDKRIQRLTDAVAVCERDIREARETLAAAMFCRDQVAS